MLLPRHKTEEKLKIVENLRFSQHKFCTLTVHVLESHKKLIDRKVRTPQKLVVIEASTEQASND